MSYEKKYTKLSKIIYTFLNSSRANPTKWLNTLKQFVGNLLTNYLSVFNHLVKRVKRVKGLKG